MIEYSGKAVLVDAIEEGRIVRVPEDYARREGLLILRREADIPSEPLTPKGKRDAGARKNKGFIGMDDLRKPLRPNQDELLRELVDNFHWVLVEKRKAKGLTRKKLAESVGETELNVKMLENGILPMNNFILINKLESFYGVSLRKNKVATAEGEPLRQIINYSRKEEDMGKEVGKTGEIIDLSGEDVNKQENPDSDSVEIIDLDKS